MTGNLAHIIEQVEKDKGIDKKILIEALESALVKAAEKRFGPNKMIEAHYNEEAGEIELFVFKSVVDDVKDPDKEISIEDARRDDPEAAAGDSLGLKLNSSEFGSIDAQTAKQIIIQKVREGERDLVFHRSVEMEPCEMAKIAVLSHNSDVDPVGACVGLKGSRVQAVVQELKGEKIDIVHWADEPAIFV